MTHNMKKRYSSISKIVLALLAVALPMLAQADQHEAPAASTPAPVQAEAETNGRAVAMQIEAEVTAIDLETREVTLQGPEGNSVTLVAQEQVVKLEDVSVGDRVLVSYFAALEGELRAPTAEELAEPWLELDESEVSDDNGQPSVAGARLIRAVVTIEGMNRELGTVTIKDSRGKLHLIGDVEAEKMAGVTLGQTAVVVFTEALAVSLEKKAPAAQ